MLDDSLIRETGNFCRSRDDTSMMGSCVSDAELMARSLRDPGLFSEVYERHLRAVGLYAARRVGSDLAEDVAAEVFVRAFRARGRFTPETPSALPWLLGIANHVIGDHRRAERRRLATLQRLARLGCESVEDGRSIVAPELVGKLKRLPAVYRDTLLLVVWGELSYEEAAAALGVPVGTVRSRVARSRRILAGANDSHGLSGGVLKGEAHV
jgi:RNA polymerase sigma-70 factor, ECF subfamily